MISNEFRFVVLLLFSIGKAFFFINNVVTLRCDTLKLHPFCFLCGAKANIV